MPVVKKTFAPKINNNNPSIMHHWPCIFLDILPPWFVYKHGCVISPQHVNTAISALLYSANIVLNYQ